MYNENKKGIADDISSRLPPIVIVGRSIFFLSSSSVFFFSFLFSSFLCTMKRTRLSTRCVFFLSFFLPSLFVSLLSWFEFCLCHVPFFSFFFSLLFFPKICGRKKGRKLFDHCDCVIGRTLGKAKSLAAWPTIVEETKKKSIVERDATTSAYKMLESKESRRGKNFWKEGGARTEDPSDEIVSLTEAESSACDEESRNGRTMAKKNACKRGESSRNREKERKFKIPHNGAKMESWDQRELSERKITIPRNKGSSTCDENENESERGERFSLARIKSPSKGSRRKRSFVLARNDWNGSEDEDEDEREGMKIHARRRSRGDGREKISFARMEREPSSTSSSNNVVPHVRIERLASRDEIVDERDERKEIKREESSSASSGSLEWMDAGDARRYTKSYRCEWCEKTFDRATNLSSHLNRTCLRNPDTMRRQNFIDTLYVCDTCGRRFKHRKNLTFHSRNECGKVSTCEFCKKDFKAAKVPYRHREACKRKHEQTNAISVVLRTRASRGHDGNDSIVSDSSTSNFMFEVISDSE